MNVPIIGKERVNRLATGRESHKKESSQSMNREALLMDAITKQATVIKVLRYMIHELCPQDGTELRISLSDIDTHFDIDWDIEELDNCIRVSRKETKEMNQAPMPAPEGVEKPKDKPNPVTPETSDEGPISM